MKLIKIILTLLLILAMTVSAVSCNKDTDSTGENDGDYTVTVRNPLGHPIAGVTVFVHQDTDLDFNVCMNPMFTDENGQVSFSLPDPSMSYSVGIMNHPEVYTAKSGSNRAERYAIESEDTEIVLGVKENYTAGTYGLGDYMADFTLTDIDGNEYGLYDLLRDQKLVVLNFWFTACDPCAREFPALNSAYNSYKDKVQVLAINDCDSLYMIQGYEEKRGFTLDVPLFRADEDSLTSVSRFGTGSWPTTVIINRYGMISMLHAGSLTSADYWTRIFDYFTSASYSGELVKDVKDIL